MMILEDCVQTRRDKHDFRKVKAFIEVVERYHLLESDAKVVDLCCGNGMLGFYLLERYPNLHLSFLDKIKTNSFKKLESRLGRKNPFLEEDIFGMESLPEGLLLSIHACNYLTDKIIELGLKQQQKFVIMTCCHDKTQCPEYNHLIPPGAIYPLGLGGYIDLGRVLDIRRKGRQCYTECIDPKITPKNNVIIAD